MSFRDSGEKNDNAEDKLSSDNEELKSNNAESEKIGKELEGNGEKKKEKVDSENPESKKNKGLDSPSDVKKAQDKIGDELEGKEIKEEEEGKKEVKRNKDGEIIEGEPKVRDEKYLKHNDNGELKLDVKGKTEVDWEGYVPKAKEDTKAADGSIIRKGEPLTDEEGFDKTKEIKENSTLKSGDIVDRYGSGRGTYLSPEGTPYEQRSLPGEESTQEYHKYRVVKDIPCKEGAVGENFEQSGGGTQYKLDKPVDYYVNNGYLEEVNDDNP